MILDIAEETHARLLALANELGVHPERALDKCIRAGLAEVLSGSRLLRESERAAIPWVETARGQQVSPARAAGLRPNGVCHGCGASATQLHCPTCRGRAGSYGWCSCGAALYGSGRGWPVCKPRGRKRLRAHREYASALRRAKSEITA